MKRQMNIALIAILLLGLLLGMAVSAYAGWGWEKELTVCRYVVSLNPDDTLYMQLSVRSSGDIAGNTGQLFVSKSRPDAAPSDAEAAATAFVDLAKSIPCTVGSLPESLGGGEAYYSVECVCKGTRDRLISVTGKMMKFVITSSATP